ncbi:SH3 domain-containing protein [Peptoniphilus sp.]|jgi:hypothetical protein|uniref:SH3 domain-containing protein n=1 Tax=Peptoniphilus sp. TaxID=1971214 RepID=UPI003D8BCC34
MSNTNNKKLSLKSFDKALLVSVILLVVVYVIGFVKLSTINDPTPRDFSFLSKTFGLVKIIYVVALVIFLYTVYVRSKKGRNFKILSNIMLSIGFILFLLNFTVGAPFYEVIDKMAESLNNLMNMNFGGALSSGAGAYGSLYSMSKARETIVDILLFASPIVMAIAAFILYRKIYKGRDMTVGDEAVISKTKFQEGFNKTRDNIANKMSEVSSQMSADNISDYDVDESESVEDSYKEKKTKSTNREDSYEESKFERDYDDYDDYDDDLNYNGKNIDSKKIFKIGGIILGIIIAIFIIKFAIDKARPDAVVDTSGVSINIAVDGVDGYAKATADIVGEFSLKDVSDNIDRYELMTYLNSLPIELNKEENIKNKDKITATLKLDKGNYKIKFDQDEIKEELTVKDLPKLINSIKDIPNEVLNTIDSKIKKSIQQYAGDSAKNLKIERLRIYEEVASEDDLKDLENQYSSMFNIMSIYQAEFDSYYGDHYSYLFTYLTSDFSENNGAYQYYINREGRYDITELGDIDNNLKYAGYKEVSEFRKDITAAETVEKPEESEEEKQEEKEETIGTNDKLKQLAYNLNGTSRTVKGKGNLRTGPSLNSQAIVQLGDNAVVEIFETVIQGERVWCHVYATNTDGSVYEGWISNRVLNI